MSIFLEPLESRSRFETALPPAEVTGSLNGSAVELPDCDGPVIALVHLAEVPDEITFAVAFQESDTGSSWSAISGSSVPNLASDSVVLHTFERTKRYLRCAVTLTGDDPSVTFGVLLGQGVKVF